MSDPEALYGKLVSGHSGTLRHHAGTLDAVMTALDGAVETTTAATEGAARAYDSMVTGADFGPDWGSFDDDEDLWASEHMTRTPLSELGLSEDVEVQPQTLRGAASDLDGIADQLRSQAGRTLGVHVSAHALGQVPAADEFAAMVNDMVERTNRSLRNGQRAATAIADMLVDMARICGR